MPEFNWDYWRSLQNGPQEATAIREAEALANQRAMEAAAVADARSQPGFSEITNGITPGVWATIQGPHQGSGPEQAIAEYQARVSQPRIDAFGAPLTEDTPAALRESLLAPFHLGLKTGMAAFKPVAAKPPQSRNVGGALVERHPVTGEWEVKVPARGKPDAATTSKRRILEAAIIGKQRELGNELTSFRPESRKRIQDEIDTKQAELDALLGGDAAPQSAATPFDGVMRRLPTGFIGKPEGEFPGGRAFGSGNRFLGNPTVSPSGASSPAPALSVGTILKGYRFKGGNPAQRENWEKVQ